MTGKLAITVGIPLSGKTVFAKKMMKCGWTVINRDTFRGVYDHSDRRLLESYAEEVVADCIDLTVKSLLKYGHDVLLDETNGNKKRRKYWSNVAKSYGSSELEIYVLPYDVDLSIKRNKQIGRFCDGYGTPSDKVIQKFVKNYTPPDETEGKIIEVEL